MKRLLQKGLNYSKNYRKVSVRGKNLNQLLAFEDGRQIYHPRWSPDDSKIIFDTAVDYGRNIAEYVLKIPDAERWSPDEPNLYTLTVEIAGSDDEQVRFGMRELTIRNNRFELNGKPTYIKAAFFEGLYPHNLALPDSLWSATEPVLRRSVAAGSRRCRSLPPSSNSPRSCPRFRHSCPHRRSGSPSRHSDGPDA